MGIPVTTYDVGKDICDALGLDPDMVRSVTIKFEVPSLVIAEVEQFIDKEQSEKLMKVLNAYKWEEGGK
jgi:hypothetical protein